MRPCWKDAAILVIYPHLTGCLGQVRFQNAGRLATVLTHHLSVPEHMFPFVADSRAKAKSTSEVVAAVEKAGAGAGPSGSSMATGGRGLGGGMGGGQAQGGLDAEAAAGAIVKKGSAFGEMITTQVRPPRCSFA